MGVGAGEGEGLHGQLQRHGGHGVQAEHVAQHQVPVLVPGQQAVVTRQQTCRQIIKMLKLCYNFTPSSFVTIRTGLVVCMNDVQKKRVK